MRKRAVERIKKLLCFLGIHGPSEVDDRTLSLKCDWCGLLYGRVQIH